MKTLHLLIIKIIFSIIILNVSAYSQTYQTVYQPYLGLSKFQSHKYNLDSKKLLIFQLNAFGANVNCCGDTLNGNTFIIDPVTYAVRMPFNSAFRSACCYDWFWEYCEVAPFDVICISGNDPNFILGSRRSPGCSSPAISFISYDGGITLNLLGLPAPLYAISIDPGNDNIIYATSNNSIYKSTNRGSSFNVLSQINNLRKILRVSPFNASHVFVSDSLGMQISTNSGLSFTRLDLPQFREMYFYNDRPVVYGAGNGGVFKSADNGLNWVQLSSLAASCIEINPDDSSIIYIGTDNNGVYRSINGGQTFNHSEINFPNSNQILGLSKDANSGDTIIVCTRNGIYKVWDLQTAITMINSTVPEKYSLNQNYPNPFNQVTKIKFDITSNVRRQTSNVKLVVFDILGKEVATLVNEKLSAGSYEVEFDGSNLSSGIYFYRLETESFVKTKSMVLLK